MASEQGDIWIGFDLGGTKMLATVFDHEFRILGRERKKTKGREGSDAVTSRMVRTLRQAIENAEIAPKHIRGIGIGCPGPVDQHRGIVREAVNLGWENVRLADLMEAEFGCSISITNDVDAGVYGEYSFGAAKSAHTVVGVFPGTGIGGGSVIEGRIVTGKKSSCMEIGHIQVTRNGRLCGCGFRGCLETEASRLSISAEVAAAAFRGETKEFEGGVTTDLADIRSGILAAAVENGDSTVEQIIRFAASQLGIGIASIVHLLAPDVIVLGGGLVEAMPEIYLEEVAIAANANVMDSFKDSFKVVVAELGDDATVMGAAAWAKKKATDFATSSNS